AGRAEKSDAAGHFEITGLEPGTYALMARHPVLGFGLSVDVVVEREAEATTDIVLSKGVPVTGRLTGAAERPIAGLLALEQMNGSLPPRALVELLQAQAETNGVFVLPGVPAGVHTLAITANGHAEKRIDVDVGSRSDRMDLGDITL